MQILGTLQSDSNEKPLLNISHESRLVKQRKVSLKWVRFLMDWTDWMSVARKTEFGAKKHEFQCIFPISHLLLFLHLMLLLISLISFAVFPKQKWSCIRILLFSLFLSNGVYVQCFRRFRLQFRIPYHHICFARKFPSIRRSVEKRESTRSLAGMCFDAVTRFEHKMSGTLTICSNFNANGDARWMKTALYFQFVAK